jgi:hypothetical protein
LLPRPRGRTYIFNTLLHTTPSLVIFRS